MLKDRSLKSLGLHDIRSPAFPNPPVYRIDLRLGRLPERWDNDGVVRYPGPELVEIVDALFKRGEEITELREIPPHYCLQPLNPRSELISLLYVNTLIRSESRDDLGAEGGIRLNCPVVCKVIQRVICRADESNVHRPEDSTHAELRRREEFSRTGPHFIRRGAVQQKIIDTGTTSAHAWNFSRSEAEPVIRASLTPAVRMARHL